MPKKTLISSDSGTKKKDVTSIPNEDLKSLKKQLEQMDKDPPYAEIMKKFFDFDFGGKITKIEIMERTVSKDEPKMGFDTRKDTQGKFINVPVPMGGYEKVTQKIYTFVIQTDKKEGLRGFSAEKTVDQVRELLDKLNPKQAAHHTPTPKHK